MVGWETGRPYEYENKLLRYLYLNVSLQERQEYSGVEVEPAVAICPGVVGRNSQAAAA